jgi:hypothetical protein
LLGIQTNEVLMRKHEHEIIVLVNDDVLV